MGGSKEQPTQTTTQTLSPEQREMMNLAMPGVRSFAATVPQRYQGNTVAGFDPSQTQGQGMALDTAGGTMQNLADAGAATSNQLMSSPWDPNNNAMLKGAVDAAVRPVTEQYQQVVRPALRDDFQSAGQAFGGSRRNIAEGNAANSYMRNVGDTSAKVVNDNYSTNIGAMTKALGLLPQTQQASLAPSLTTSGVGDVRQAMDQAQLDAKVSGYNYDQLAPFLQSKEIMSLLAGLPGGSVTSTGNNPTPNKALGALGGAASGAALGSMILPGAGTAAGAGLGALMAFL